jgi:hypothetical protein
MLVGVGRCAGRRVSTRPGEVRARSPGLVHSTRVRVVDTNTRSAPSSATSGRVIRPSTVAMTPMGCRMRSISCSGRTVPGRPRRPAARGPIASMRVSGSMAARSPRRGCSPLGAVPARTPTSGRRTATTGTSSPQRRPGSAATGRPDSPGSTQRHQHGGDGRADHRVWQRGVRPDRRAAGLHARDAVDGQVELLIPGRPSAASRGWRRPRLTRCPSRLPSGRLWSYPARRIGDGEARPPEALGRRCRLERLLGRGLAGGQHTGT